MRMSVWVGFEEIYCITCAFSAYAKNANYSQTIRITRSFILYSPLKLIGADHVLHTSSGV